MIASIVKMSKSREQLVSFLKEIDITDKVVLDAGCGPEEKWARNWTNGEAKRYITLDISSEFKTTIVADLNVKLPTFKLAGLSHIVFCLETLEHLWNPIYALRNIYQWLFIGGTAYFSTPLINPHHDEVDYARYTDEWYQKVLSYVGFKDIKIKPRVATEGYANLLAFYKEEGLRMSKIRLKKGQANKMNEIGYFVEARK